MRRHAKAATAGSTQRRAGRHARATLFVAGALALLALALVPAAASAAAPEAFWTRCNGVEAGDVACSVPRGIAASPINGDVYVGDSARRRVLEYSPWGVFLRAWGWDVVQSGPDNNGTGFEICMPANGDVCKAGTEGTGAGQFGVAAAQGVAIDSEGDVYVLDRGEPSNNRVQKFDPEGHFLRMWGGEVNSGTSGNPNICTNAGPPTDVCKAGSTGSANGQFGELSVVGSYIAIDTAGTSTASDDKVYLGDQERIQSFNSAGEYQSQIAQPGVTVKGLAVDPAGNLYASFCGTSCGSSEPAKANVRKLSPAGVELGTVTVANPQALATDSAGDLYVVDGDSNPTIRNPTIREFTPAGVEVPGFAFKDGFSESTGIATGSACLSAGHDLYVSNALQFAPNGFLRAYGPVPDEAHIALCPPPPQAPEIVDQGTLSVESDRATVQATITPKFWADTAYYLQYATAACIEAGGWGAACVAQKPASPTELGAGATGNPTKTAKVSLAGLTPQTEYTYRFVAESSGGGPVFGKGGTEAVEGGATAFRTTAVFVLGGEESCANAIFRSGPSAALPDCRAYEMVSPVDKNGGDVKRLGAEYSYIQTSPDGNRLTYSADPTFGDQPSSRSVNQYLANRQEGVGWSNHGLNAPLGRQPQNIPAIARDAEAFSADLCSEWLQDHNFTPLTADAQPGYHNLYRQDLCGGGGLEALTTTAPAPGAQPEYVSTASIQGIAAGSGEAFFTARAALTPDAALGTKEPQLYERSSGELHLVSVLRSGAADPGAEGTVGKNGAAVGGGLTGGNTGANLEHAVSEDGSRVYWTSQIEHGGDLAKGPDGKLYLRQNPTQPQSALAHGGARGEGDLSVVNAFALTIEGTTEVLYFAASGEFKVGDPIEGEGIPAGTTIVTVNEVAPGEGEMTVSAPSTATEIVEISSASKTVSNLTTSFGAFAIGQTVVGAGIPAGTTIVAVNAAEHTLTLSAPPSAGFSGISLEAFSECTEAAKACTVEVSTGRGFSEEPAAFWSADPSGSIALYSEGFLEDEATGQSKAILYRFDAATQTRAPVAEHFRGMLGASRDLSRIYFVSTAALTPGQKNAEGAEAVGGEPNIYLDEGGTMTFIATLLGGPHGDVFRMVGEEGAYNVASYNPSFRTARVTPDGERLVFQSRARLTGYDNTDAASGKPDVEVFTYAAGGALQCISCDPSGARPNGGALHRVFEPVRKTEAWGAAWILPAERPLHSSNILSEDGRRLFFLANDALVSHDTNGVQDVYEWELAGTGGCGQESPTYREANGGCVYLISSGESPAESEFWEASPDGRDVFFTTESSLLPQDPGSVDVYDARIGGGFAQPGQLPACEGESCQSAPAPPVDPSLSSASFKGAGNPKPKASRRCAKSKRAVRKAGKTRCVAKHKHKRAHKRNANHNRRTAR